MPDVGGMSGAYAIKDWDTLYETHDTRKLKSLSWVPVRNKQDGKGYRLIMAHPRGMEIFAAWVLMLQVASRCPKRGILADEDGPLDSIFLAAKTGGRADVFDLALEYLSSARIGWLTQSVRSAACPIREILPETDQKTGDSPEIVPGIELEQEKEPPTPTPMALATVENKKAPVAAAAGVARSAVAETEKPPAPAARPIPVDRAQHDDDEPDRCELARSLVNDLMPEHPRPGNAANAIAAAERLLAASVDPGRICGAIRRTHAAWVAYWLTLPPSAFRPMLHRWFSDGDYLHPPSRAAPTAVDRRRETLGDRLLREANEEEHAEQNRSQAPSGKNGGPTPIRSAG